MPCRLTFLLLAGLALAAQAAAQEDPVVAMEEETAAPAPGTAGLPPHVSPALAAERLPDAESRQGGTVDHPEVHEVRPARAAAARLRHQWVLVAGSAAIFCLLVLWMGLRRRRARRPRLFPYTVPRERFSAPHSGGNNAMISFARDHAHDPG
jgi:hypothetical protein